MSTRCSRFGMSYSRLVKAKTAVSQQYVEAVALSSFSLHTGSAVVASWMHVAELGGSHRARAWTIYNGVSANEGQLGWRHTYRRWVGDG